MAIITLANENHLLAAVWFIDLDIFLNAVTEIISRPANLSVNLIVFAY